MLRRRKESPGSMDNSLREPLLTHREQRHDDRTGDGSPERRAPPRSRPASFFRSLLLKLQRFLNDILDWLHFNVASLFHRHPMLSLQQEERLKSLQERAAAPFNPSGTDHHALLQRLWTAAFAGEPFPAKDLKSPLWKQMGWQGEDPSTDIRGGGMLALELLVYFAEEQPEEFLRLMRKEGGTRSAWEYPFAAAGVNITFMLVDVLDLRNASPQVERARTPASAGFIKLLETSDGEVVLGRLFAETFTTLDEVWLEQRATYMEFGVVKEEVGRRIVRALGRRWLTSPDDLSTLRDEYR